MKNNMLKVVKGANRNEGAGKWVNVFLIMKMVILLSPSWIIWLWTMTEHFATISSDVKLWEAMVAAVGSFLSVGTGFDNPSAH